MPRQPKRMGRPPKEGATRHTIRVTDRVWRLYKRIGDGDATRGIEIAAKHLAGIIDRLPQGQSLPRT